MASFGVGCSDADSAAEADQNSELSSAEVKANAIETWAFCGVNPDDPAAVTAAHSMATVAGINATMGPCRPGGANYSAAFPGSRYVSPEDYLKVAYINASAGMKTIVYDARLWDDSATVRQTAIDYWAPYMSLVRAWDMGDEFDPNSEQWNILVHRWNIMITNTLPATGVGPYVNQLGNAQALDRALADLPLAGVHLSFDLYDFPAATDLAAAYHTRAAHLMCAANALAYDPAHVPTQARLTKEIKELRFAGCGSILVFGGFPVVGSNAFGPSSLVTPSGKPTPLAYAVRAGAR